MLKDKMDLDPSSHTAYFMQDGNRGGPQLLVGDNQPLSLENQLLHDAENFTVDVHADKSKVLEILMRTDDGRRQAEEIYGPNVWGNRPESNDPLGIGVGAEGEGDDSMFVDLVNQDDDDDGKKHGDQNGFGALDEEHQNTASTLLDV